ncbi:hypothetical protein [Aeromonas sp. 603359]|uniref:hypothetical protein n=1 Tax=Aeromonas sp. 603359 TaxID=2712046 RepID=UPI003BA2BA96
MVDLLPIFIKVTETIKNNMHEWFEKYPDGMPWTVVSDYCVGDNEKNNDVFSFVIIANHDKTENIMEYISKVAPRDLKKVRRVPQGLIDYLTCEYPITFSISFVINRKSALLRDYLGVAEMREFIPDVSNLINSLKDSSLKSDTLDPTYFTDTLKRLDVFLNDLGRKQLNVSLARQIHLASSFAATVFYLVTKSTGAGHIRWVSDRDKLIEHNDTVVYDLSYIYFILMLSACDNNETNELGNVILNNPNVTFEVPDKVGKNRFDALIRLPDYLAGTLADISENLTFSKDKFYVVFQSVYVHSSNNCIVQLGSDGENIFARSVLYR